MDISDADLLKLQTRIMQNNQDVQGFSVALNSQVQQLAGEIAKALIYSNVDTLHEAVLDILAWQFKVDWYDSTSDLATKRQAINDALLIMRMRGTPAAVQRVVETYLGDGQVEEWFDYAGDPYHFRVVTNNPEATTTQAALLAVAVNGVKNLRSVMDSVIIQSTENMSLYYGFVMHTGDFLTLEQVV